LFLVFPLLLHAQFTPASYQIEGKTLQYQVMFPEGYSPGKTYPLLVFLHGAGERGNDNQKQLTHGKQFLIDNFYSKFPAIVIAPQCPADDYWANVERHQIGESYTFRFGISNQPTTSMQVLQQLVRNWIKSGKVDPSRIYLGGLSMGGMGTFELLWRMPQTFAAAFPICGGTDLTKLPLYAKHTALWLFHGDVDAVVSVENSRNAYKTLKQLGSNVKYTEYKGVNHNSWDSVFVEKELAAWLFSQKLNLRKK
jgi:predicted peptidase